MARYDNWVNGTNVRDNDYVIQLYNEEQERRFRVYKLQNDLAREAAALGANSNVIESRIDALFSTFASEWSIYILAGATAIVTAIENDATLPWLDTDIRGQTLRTRLVSRLT